MIAIGDKIVILGGEGPTGIYEDVVVELDTSRLVFPPERRNTLRTPRNRSVYPDRKFHSLKDRNWDDWDDSEDFRERPQVKRAISDRSNTRHPPARGATLTVSIPRGRKVPPNTTYTTPISKPYKPQRQGTQTQTTDGYYEEYYDPSHEEPVIQTPLRDHEPSSEPSIESPVLRLTNSNPVENRGLPETFVNITGDGADLDTFQLKYKFDDGQWPGEYIPRSEGDDFELLNFIQQHFTSATAQKLKLVVLEKPPHDYLTHYARGDGNTGSDDIEYQRYIDRGSNGEVHQVANSSSCFLLTLVDVLQENEPSTFPFPQQEGT